MASHPELVVLVVLATVLAVLVVARRTGWPYPVPLVVASTWPTRGWTSEARATGDGRRAFAVATANEWAGLTTS
jgi:hypothetical protein